MICFGVLFLSVFSLALGDDFLPPLTVTHANETSPNATSEADQNVVGVCYFGRFPSARCMFRCFLKSKSAYCDDEARCLCRDQGDKSFEESFSSPELNYTATTTEAPVLNTLPVSALLLGGRELRGVPELNYTTETTTEAPVLNTVPDTIKNESETLNGDRKVIFYIFDLNKMFGFDRNDTDSTPVSHIIPKGTSRTVQGAWSFPHLLALGILLLLAVLVVLELLNFCRKRNAKQNFRQAVLTPHVVDKVYVNDKQERT